MSILGPRELTDLERRVALLVAWGGSNREVADALSIEVRAVERHLTRVYRKLGVHSRAQLPPLLGVTPGACETPLGPYSDRRRGAKELA